jgi:peptide deformylase
MKNIKIRLRDDIIFKKETQYIDDFTRAPGLFNKMVQVLNVHGFIGLAANQIGILRKAVIVKSIYGRIYMVANPRILSHSLGTNLAYEACGSIPSSVYSPFVVKRYNEILVWGNTPNGGEFMETFKDRDARIFQHEIDHLNNIFISDRQNEIKVPTNITNRLS